MLKLQSGIIDILILCPKLLKFLQDEQAEIILVTPDALKLCTDNKS